MTSRPAFNRTGSDLSIDEEDDHSVNPADVDIDYEDDNNKEGASGKKKKRIKKKKMQTAREVAEKNSNKKASRRDSRIPRNLVESLGSQKILVTMAASNSARSVVDELSALSSSHSRLSLDPSDRGDKMKARRVKSNRSPIRTRSPRRLHTNRSNSARSLQSSSARGGAKEYRVVTEDDNWEIFKEALQNMA